ncbi:outer membrane lipid asymmetry maintenance protein MlaD [Aquicella lusitana]|uniref:Phospholipid/cholesterol/gamma-HCH transport system substrate-binding protein n=1 Tax=Aquicella lusitana TaxID=254246 RepID=A0A370GZP9_9COXI|nr:outer membrane lipid asymmetry maintenance protein MlaD [Aquicella lusitana]RDI48787.1 phospholipid/cholesterol/gamma-HCH transport system substrate-binding protein [Aquicella lusitana]VVC73215.1 putative phospholipid ABC transporter-binding protein MlaD [Aquicella lusitana]
MLPQRLIESLVGLFLLFAIIALTVLAFKVSGLTSLFPSKTYTVIASFDDIGGLKVRSSVKIGGVQIGEVSDITLDPVTFRAIVKMRIEDQFNDIPDDSSAGIFTAGLLGDNYISITPMYSKTFLKEGSQIEITRSAMVLEKLIGQLIYKIGNSGTDGTKQNTTGNGDQHANQ